MQKISTADVTNSEAEVVAEEEGFECQLTMNEIIELKNSSRSPVNFAVKLILNLFPSNELINRNVYRRQGRLALDPDKVKEVKRIYFHFYPSLDQAKDWQKCVTAINNHLREYKK